MSSYSSLNEALDFSLVETRDDIEDHFFRACDYLFNKIEIEHNNCRFRITEIEAGFVINELIQDKIHASITQRFPGNIYVHKRGGNYKARNYLGLDLTCGGERPNGDLFYGTLLLVGLKNLESGKVYDGPNISLKGLLGIEHIEGNEGRKNPWNGQELDKITAIDDKSLDSAIKVHQIEKDSDFYVGPRNRLGRTEDDEQLGDELRLRACLFKPTKAKKKMKLLSELEGKNIIDLPPQKEITTEVKRVNREDDPSIHIPTAYEIESFLEDEKLKVGGRYINADSLMILSDKSDLKPIGGNQEGCYFIFSTLPEEEIPTFSKDGYRGYKATLEKDGYIFRCLYNGKGGHLRERLQEHLFNTKTLKKILSPDYKNNNISGTGAMSLEAMSEAQAKSLELNNKFDPAKHKLKTISKAFKKETHQSAHQNYEGKDFLINGIDITEEQWSDVKFAVIVVKTDSEFGKILIEEAFAAENGRPPLCRRHG